MKVKKKSVAGLCNPGIGMVDLLSWLETRSYLHKHPGESLIGGGGFIRPNLQAAESFGLAVFATQKLLLDGMGVMLIHLTTQCKTWLLLSTIFQIWVKTYLLGICGGCTVGRRRRFCHIWLFCFWWGPSSSRGTRSRSTLYSCWGGTVCNVLPAETERTSRRWD